MALNDMFEDGMNGSGESATPVGCNLNELVSSTDFQMRATACFRNETNFRFYFKSAS